MQENKKYSGYFLEKPTLIFKKINIVFSLISLLRGGGEVAKMSYLRCEY